MGLADSRYGVYLFKEMNDPQSVRALAETATEVPNTGSVDVPETLRSHLEAKLSPRAIKKIPFD